MRGVLLTATTLYIQFLAVSNLLAQVYPPNFLWNGCTYQREAFTSKDTLNCRELSYKLVFEDEFDSTKLNRNKWQPYYPWGRSLLSESNESGWEKQFYADENVAIENGHLKLTTKLDPGYKTPVVATSVFFNYTSGMVFSVPNFTKGKFEIRCKIPSVKGMFPAFWLFGPCFQEIDIFEFTNSSETSDPIVDGGHVINTYHRYFECATPDKGVCHHGSSKNYDMDFSADFHNYSVEWNEFKIVWKVDGKVSREVYKLWTISPAGPAGSLYGYAIPIKSCFEMQPSKKYTVFEPFPTTDYRMNLIINNAVLRDRAKDSGALPQEFLIDYVRAYEEIEGDLIGKVFSPSDFTIFPNPTIGDFSFNNVINGNLISEIAISNAFGSEVAFSQVSTSENNINIKLSNEIKGVYTVRVRAGTSYYFSKLIFN